jgi:hypothetical protein
VALQCRLLDRLPLVCRPWERLIKSKSNIGGYPQWVSVSALSVSVFIKSLAVDLEGMPVNK